MVGWQGSGVAPAGAFPSPPPPLPAEHHLLEPFPPPHTSPSFSPLLPTERHLLELQRIQMERAVTDQVGVDLRRGLPD